jgi:hypothetical protein
MKNMDLVAMACLALSPLAAQADDAAEPGAAVAGSTASEKARPACSVRGPEIDPTLEDRELGQPFESADRART